MLCTLDKHDKFHLTCNNSEYNKTIELNITELFRV